MNPQWNTPPDGDFARLVERLAAEAALPKRTAPEHERALDVGMNPTPYVAAPPTASSAAPPMGPPGSVPPRPPIAAGVGGWIGRALREWVDRQIARQQNERRSK